MREFNTEGPVVAQDHYHIPPLDRANLAELRQLVDRKRCFVLHAPRQTGKTSALLALQARLNADGDYRCVYVNVEGATTAREDVDAAIRTVLNELAEAAHDTLGDGFLADTWPAVLARGGGHSALRVALTRWARHSDKPLVLLVDEIDTLMGDSLLAVLRQLRAGYHLRPEGGFPQSVILCGVRDVRDYRIWSGSTKTMVAGGSAFNIKAESLRLGDFSRDEVRDLLGQHTRETGQAFADAALEAVWSQTRGQPWLVNALAYQACFRGAPAQDRSRTVTQADVLEARETLILRRDTHLDQLTDKLREDRVWRVIEPLLAGSRESRYTDRDVEYVRDLGLIARDPPIRMANPVYAEVVPRELTWLAQDDLPYDPAWYVDASGALLLGKLLEAFQEFYRENSEHWVRPLRPKGGGTATSPAGVPAAGRQQRRADRAGVRAGQRAHGLARGVASGEASGQVRGRVQGSPRPPELGAHRGRGRGADGGVHGPLQGRSRPLGDLRPERRAQLGREGLPRRTSRRERRQDRGVGHVIGDNPARRNARLRPPRSAPRNQRSSLPCQLPPSEPMRSSSFRRSSFCSRSRASISSAMSATPLVRVGTVRVPGLRQAQREVLRVGLLDRPHQPLALARAHAPVARLPNLHQRLRHSCLSVGCGCRRLPARMAADAAAEVTLSLHPHEAYHVKACRRHDFAHLPQHPYHIHTYATNPSRW